jgi:hypothetical protein
VSWFISLIVKIKLKLIKRKNPLLLEIDENYNPAVTEEGEEFFPNGYFVFNITKMLNFISSNKEIFELKNISIKEYRSGTAVINESHVDKVDITVPIILAEISPGRYNVIDGNHRVEKAYRSGAETIPAYVLNMRQHLPFLTTVEAYRAYVGYWNEKVMLL